MKKTIIRVDNSTTLDSLAEKYHTTPLAIKNLNNLNLIYLLVCDLSSRKIKANIILFSLLILWIVLQGNLALICKE